MEAEYDNEKFYFQEHPDAILGNYRIPNSLTDLLIHNSLRTPLDESIHGRFITWLIADLFNPESRGELKSLKSSQGSPAVAVLGKATQYFDDQHHIIDRLIFFSTIWLSEHFNPYTATLIQ